MNKAQHIDREIHEQPTTIARLLADGWENAIEIAQKIRRFDPKWAVIAARGTSDNAARYGQYLLGAHNGLSVGLAMPSLHTLYKTPPNLKHGLTIGISQSGRSPDVIAVIETARQQGGITLAITNNAKSPLAESAHFVLPLLAGNEVAVAATKTYTSELLALAILSAALDPRADRCADLREIPEWIFQALSMNPHLDQFGEHFRTHDRFAVLGRGFNYCTAFEVALKMKETSYVMADAYSVADFKHGPIAMVNQDLPLIVIAPSGQASQKTGELLKELQQRNATTITVSDRVDFLAASALGIHLPTGVPEWLSPIVAIVPCQIWAKELAIARGLDPDFPRGLNKITLTH